MEAKKLRSSLECSVCFEVRRNTRIYICVNGHDVCAVFKSGKVDNAGNPGAAAAPSELTLCPECRVPYGDPPYRNLPVEKLIKESDLEFACDNKSDGCVFKGTVTVLEMHERDLCNYRMVACLEAEKGCAVRMKATDLKRHLEEEHTKCKYVEDGCNFAGKRNLVAEHEVNDCEHKLRVCWVDGCLMMVKVKDLGQHLEEWHRKCKYGEGWGCKFPPNKKALITEHEMRCEFRKVPCPGGYCNQSIKFGHIMNHLKLAHMLSPVKTSGSFCSSVLLKENWLFPTYKVQLDFGTFAFTIGDQTFVRRHRRSAEGTLYTWIKIMGSQEEADRFTADRFSVIIRAHGNEAEFKKGCKVYPVDIGDEMIEEEKDCFQMSLKQTKQFCDPEKLTEEEKKEGFVGKINFGFLLQKK